MRITEFLSEESIVPALSATRKDEALLELSKVLGRAVPQVAGPRLYSVLTEREKAASTAMEKGVAIPHGRLAELPTLVACFGVSRTGIDFEARDGRPSNFFFALLAPENSAGVHLKALAKISRMFRSDALREGILEATTAKEIYALIVQEDSRA